MTSNGSQLAMTSSPPISTATVTISTTASPQTVVIKGKRFRQRPLGPAPFASFEDLSDEVTGPLLNSCDEFLRLVDNEQIDFF